MPCQPFTLPGGARGFVCTRGRRKPEPPCACGAPGRYLCDFQVGRRTCDRPMCGQHAYQVGPDRHLCDDHVKAETGDLFQEAG